MPDTYSVVAISVFILAVTTIWFRFQKKNKSFTKSPRDRLEDVADEAKWKIIEKKSRSWILNSEISEKDKALKIRVLQYNVLADVYCSVSRYDHCPRFALHWNYRSRNLVSEMSDHNPDIICLQVITINHIRY